MQVRAVLCWSHHQVKVAKTGTHVSMLGAITVSNPAGERCLLTAPLLVTARPCYKSIRKFFIDAILYNYPKQLNIYLHLNHNFENMTPSKSVRKICEICCKNTFLHNYSMCTGGEDRVLTSEATRRYTKCVQYITISPSPCLCNM